MMDDLLASTMSPARPIGPRHRAHPPILPITRKALAPYPIVPIVEKEHLAFCRHDALDSFVTDQTACDQLRAWANTFR